MRHVVVSRTVAALAVLGGVAVGVFAWAVTRPADPRAVPAAARGGPTGAELFERHCAMCHEREKIAIDRRGSADRGAAETGLRELLVDHYGPSPEENALIVSHVLGADDPP